jgi:arsenate reductase-like glutaredoxin family protein
MKENPPPRDEPSLMSANPNLIRRPILVKEIRSFWDTTRALGKV